MACFSLHAATSCHCGLYPQSLYIYIVENTPIYDTDLQLVKQYPVKTGKKAPGIKKETPVPAESEIAKQEPVTVLLPDFPLCPSPSAFLQGGRESVAISPQQRNGGAPAAKTNCENVYPDIDNSDLSLYHPQQRQKLSTAATQCGMLTSFGSNTPPLKSLSLRA